VGDSESPSKLGRDLKSLWKVVEIYRALPSCPDVWVDAGEGALVKERELQEASERERTAAPQAEHAVQEALERERMMNEFYFQPTESGRT
jgi:Zn-finger nucleic acid-binding protein